MTGREYGLIAKEGDCVFVIRSTWRGKPSYLMRVKCVVHFSDLATPRIICRDLSHSIYWIDNFYVYGNDSVMVIKPYHRIAFLELFCSGNNGGL